MNAPPPALDATEREMLMELRRSHLTAVRAIEKRLGIAPRESAFDGSTDKAHSPKR